MVKVIQNFSKKDCVHYETQDIPACCGRTNKAGVCTIEWRRDKGPRICSTKMAWCRYEKQGEADVHSTQLPNSNGGNS